MNEIGSWKYHKRISAWWDALTLSGKYALIFAGFLGFFLLLLSPIPLSGSILGTVDTLFIPGLSNTFLNRIRAVVFGEFVGQSMYPADIARYGEISPGVASIFVLFRALGVNNVHSLYFTQALLFSLMAFAMVLFARHFTHRYSSAIFAALIFSTSNFMWANVDDLPIHFYFLPLLSAHLLKKAIQNGTSKDLLIAGALGGFQIYFSVQVYVYQTLILGTIIIFGLRQWWAGFSLKEKALFAIAYTVIPLPLVLYYLNTVVNLGVVNLWGLSVWNSCYSLQLPELFSSLPDKLIDYPFIKPYSRGASYTLWCGVRNLAFIGFGIPALAIIGLKHMGKQKLEALALVALGLFFSLGSFIEIGQWRIPSPLYFFYEYIPLAQYLRVALRSFSITVMGLAILAAVGLEVIMRSSGRISRKMPAAVLVLATLFILGENVSWPLNRYETIAYPGIPDGYVDYFKDKPEALILDLPSLSASWPGYIDEIIYVIWQTEHKRNIVGGVTGYHPPSRMEAQVQSDLLPSDKAFCYFKGLGVTHFVWHNSAHLNSHTPGSLTGIDQFSYTMAPVQGRDYSWLEASPWLLPVFKNNLITIYALRGPDSACDEWKEMGTIR